MKVLLRFLCVPACLLKYREDHLEGIVTVTDLVAASAHGDSEGEKEKVA